jgi:uncharacterized protein (TIGR03086 family)
MSIEPLELAFTSTRGVLANVTPEQLDLPTPCASWNVRNLVNHLVGLSHWFATGISSGVTPPLPAETNFADGDILAAYDDGIQESLTAFSTPGALDKTVKLPFGEFLGSMFMALATNDTFTHGWDLAKATGQSTQLTPELAEQVLAQARGAIPDEFRGPDGTAPFGPIVEVADSAPAADRLAAFLGRTP